MHNKPFHVSPAEIMMVLVSRSFLCKNRPIYDYQGYNILDKVEIKQKLYQSLRLSTSASGRVEAIRPPLNKKSFPVHRPGGLKRAEWEVFYFHVFKKKIPLAVHSSV